MRQIFLTAAALLSTPAWPAGALTVPDCMDRPKVLQAVQAQGMDARILSPEQNERWRAWDQANSPQPDAPGFTYLLAWMGDLPVATIVGFGPDGCYAYYAQVPKELALEHALGGAK